MAVTVTDSNFEQEVLGSDIPVVVDFWAPWCGPCRALSPVLDQLGEELAGKVKIAKVNVDENQSVASSLHITSIPALFIFKGGQCVDKRVGAVPKTTLAGWINGIVNA
ncbi:MAG: thioredoxin [Methylobacteriaceae bacterium]|jgi:thioredoxin 1|nr:thioredoxin [Methylobacteriaceae bacterium]